MMRSRKQTYRTIINRYYLFDSVFHELGVDIHSPSYYRNVLQSIFSNSENYSLIYADADKMREFNTNYSEKQGDIAISNSLSSILSNLPSNTIPFRIGGDEFGFYLPNSSKMQLQEPVQKIKSLLKEKQETYPQEYIGMSLGVADSQNKNYMETLEEAEKSAISNKKSRLPTKQNSWQQIEKQCFLAWKEYFNLRRIEPKVLSNADINELSQQIHVFFKIAIDKAQSGIQNDFNNMVQKPIAPQDANIPYPDIHHFLTSTNNETTANVTEQDLRSLLSIICKNGNTNLFNKTYFETFLEHKYASTLKEGEKYLVIMYHTTGLKESNDLCGHIQTDTSLAQTASTIKNSQKVTFNQTPLSFSNDNMMIDFNGGNFLQIINTKEIPNFSKNFYLATTQINAQLPNDFFHVVSSYQIIEKGKNLSRCIEDLKTDCAMKNTAYKNSLSTSHESKELDVKLKLKVFSNVIHQFLKNYGNDEPPSTDKKRFLFLISDTYQKLCKEKATSIPNDFSIKEGRE